ncbi:hypothetical protein G3N55_00185 [Dissulfurirhabdus thermomarina]|uniref:Toprim domain-containing protein n=1 Tax=Dissulfurirhabdus thermomarina TaxID=1765737 RepID=A0A6N9TJK3_DISTH|nr:toprim domain-containing protein [Dissulfurirhabdus thermomarina]NDY41268.1 hypothetical protein [Dissulfurirhabdus thermomarina]
MWPARHNGLGGYWCRNKKCGRHGDAIQFLRDFHGLSYREACARLGIDLPDRPRSMVRVPRLPRLRAQGAPAFRPNVPDTPAGAWRNKAAEFVRACHARLMSDPDALAWLEARGLDRDAAVRYRLGYHATTEYRARAAWGLPTERRDDGRPKALWLPAGWVIPVLDAEDHVVHLRIRRPDEDRQRRLAHLKYYVVPGSSSATLVIDPRARAYVVVESALDAMLCGRVAADLEVGAICTWNATAKPDRYATECLSRALRILVALDADEAGERAASWWLQTFRAARRLAPDGGKDPGEMAAVGADIRAWIRRALPPALTLRFDQPPPQRKPQDVVVSEASNTTTSCGHQPNPGALGHMPAVVVPHEKGEALRALAAIMRRYKVYLRKRGEAIGVDDPWRVAEEEVRRFEALVWSLPVLEVLLEMPDGLIGHRQVLSCCR